MVQQDLGRLERILLLHLLEHHGQQVRFEASQWATEFGILRRFTDESPLALRGALRTLEMARMVYQRTQYVVGYSEPKHVFSLTPVGHRAALEQQREAEAAGSGATALEALAPNGGTSESIVSEKRARPTS